MLPFESTICQCGSGVPGTLKSSERVRMFLPAFTVWVTVPVFAFAPWNLVLMWVSSANAVVVTRANTANAAMSVFFISVFCNAFFGLFAFAREDHPQRALHG